MNTQNEKWQGASGGRAAADSNEGEKKGRQRIRISGSRVYHTDENQERTYGANRSKSDSNGYQGKTNSHNRYNNLGQQGERNQSSYGNRDNYRPNNYGNSEQRANRYDKNERPSYGNNRQEGSSSSYGNRPYNNNRSEGDSNNNRPYNNNRSEGGSGYSSRPAYGNREGGNSQGNRPAYGNREGGNSYGNRPAYGNREGGNSYGNRPAYGNREGGSNYGNRPAYGNREGGNSYGNRPVYSSNREGNNSYGKRPQNTNRAGGGYNRDRFGVDGEYNPNAKYSKKKQFEYQQREVDMTKPVRLNKFLANSGVCSRREADEYIAAGVITVNGEVVTELGVKIMPSDKVMFHDQIVRSERKVYLLLNKPKNCVTTTEDTHDRMKVLDLVKNACSERIYPVGRLDRNTTGVLLLTNDGDLAAKLTHPKYEKKKIYHVSLDKPLEIADFETLLAGIELDDEKIIPDALEFINDDDRSNIGIEIHSGQNRVVRRIFEKVGYKVIRLDRVFFAGLTKKNVQRGKYRFLNPREINMLKMGAFE